MVVGLKLSPPLIQEKNCKSQVLCRYADTQIYRYTDIQICRYTDTQIGVPAMASNQLPEVVVGCADHPHPHRISKLSLKYWRNKQRIKQESMPVIPFNLNHPAASPSAALRESPQRAAKTRANNALLHVASASAPWCHDVASVASASVATDAGNAAGLADAHAVTDVAAAGRVSSPACSVNSSNSSDSDDLDMIGGDCVDFGRQSTGLTDFTNSPPPREDYFSADGDDVDEENTCPLMRKQVTNLFWIVSSITWSGRLLLKIIARLWSL